MNLKKSILILTATASLGLNTAFAVGPKTYQVTGPVLAVTDSVITVQKGSDRWEIARDASAKVTGDLKVGSKVTITYTMTASAIDAKADKKAAAPAVSPAKP